MAGKPGHYIAVLPNNTDLQPDAAQFARNPFPHLGVVGRLHREMAGHGDGLHNVALLSMVAIVSDAGSSGPDLAILHFLYRDLSQKLYDAGRQCVIPCVLAVVGVDQFHDVGLWYEFAVAGSAGTTGSRVLRQRHAQPEATAIEVNPRRHPHLSISILRDDCVVAKYMDNKVQANYHDAHQ